MTLRYLVFIGMCSVQFSRGELAWPVYTGCHEKLRPQKLRPTLRLLPTFKSEKNHFFFYLPKLKFIILSNIYRKKNLKISKIADVI